jgi:signal transduction histidine kinase
VLAGVAAYGLNSLAEKQRREARANLEPALQTVAGEFRKVLREELAKSPPVFLPPAAPMPGASNEAADQLVELTAAADSLAAMEQGAAHRDLYNTTWFGLCALRDNAALSHTLTASGLPVRTMAAWQTWSLTLAPEDAATLARVAMEVPCYLSGAFITRMLARVEEETPGAAWLEPLRHAWQTSQERQWILEPDADGDYGLVDPRDTDGVPPGEYFLRLRGGTGIFRDPAGNQGLWLVDRADDASAPEISQDAIRTLSPGELRTIADRVFAHFSYLLPSWAVFRCPDLDEPDHERQAMLGNPLVSTGEKGSVVPEFGIFVQDAAAYSATLRSLQGWALAVIGSAFLTATLGLWLVHRTLHKEHRLGKLKSQFVSSVSHELRAPIGSLRLMAEGLASGKVSGKAADDFHRLMAGEGARLSSLIENVLDFARIEQGRKQYHMAETDVAALVQDAVKLMQPQAEARGLKIMTELEPLPFVPKVDAGALQQALINLLDNAVKFTSVARASSPQAATEPDCGLEARATILVTLAADPSLHLWSLAVTDQGGGIPEEEHTRIFERFYRLGNELRRETTGTGIGLALVKHIVEGHGGRVRVKSAPGQGSTFTMLFPFVA